MATQQERSRLYLIAAIVAVVVAALVALAAGMRLG